MYVAVAGRGRRRSRRFHWTGDRSENKRLSAEAALELLLAHAAREDPRVTVRGAAEIGAGLAPARAARAIRPGERIHVVGAQGAGASAAALLAAWAGADVDGCDRAARASTRPGWMPPAWSSPVPTIPPTSPGAGRPGDSP